MAKADQSGLIWAGVGLAAVGAVLYRRSQAAKAAAASSSLLSPYPSVAAPGYRPAITGGGGSTATTGGGTLLSTVTAPTATTGGGTLLSTVTAPTATTGGGTLLSTVTAPTVPVVVTLPAASIVAPPAPAVGVSSSDAAFNASMASAHAMQRDDFNRGAADLLARVNSGAITPGSAAYAEAFSYLSNLTGGTAGQASEAAKLTAAGLPSPN